MIAASACVRGFGTRLLSPKETTKYNSSTAPHHLLNQIDRGVVLSTQLPDIRGSRHSILFSASYVFCVGVRIVQPVLVRYNFINRTCDGLLSQVAHLTRRLRPSGASFINDLLSRCCRLFSDQLVACHRYVSRLNVTRAS